MPRAAHGTTNRSHTARALLAGYAEVAGALPPVSEAMFRGTATSLVNYVKGQVELALSTGDGYDRRSVAHLLTRLPDRAAFETLLAVVRE